LVKDISESSIEFIVTVNMQSPQLGDCKDSKWAEYCGE